MKKYNIKLMCSAQAVVVLLLFAPMSVCTELVPDSLTKRKTIKIWSLVHTIPMRISKNRLVVFSKKQPRRQTAWKNCSITGIFSVPVWLLCMKLNLCMFLARSVSDWCVGLTHGCREGCLVTLLSDYFIYTM